MITYFPIFQGITHFANPKLEAALASVPVSVIADPSECSFQFNPVGTAKFTTRHRQVSAGVLRVAGSRFWVVESPNPLYPLSVKNVPAYTADLLFLPLVIGRHKSIAKDIRPMRQLAKTFDSHNAYTRRNLLNSPFGICARKCRHQNYRTPQNNYKKRQRHKDYEP